MQIEQIKKFNQALNAKKSELSYEFAPEPFRAKTKVEPTEETFDRDWLLGKCEEHVSNYALSTGMMDAVDLCVNVFEILQKDGEVESELVDILGYDNFGLITTLIENRSQLVENIMFQYQQRVKADTKSKTKQKVEQRMPIYGTQVTVMTQSEKDFMKQQAKLMKSQKRVQKLPPAIELLGLDGFYLKNAREAQLIENSSGPMFSNKVVTGQEIVYPNVYQTEPQNKFAMLGTKFVLPAGTTREDDADYEEVTIPGAKKAPMRVNESLIDLNSFEEWIRPCYKGYSTLNRVQSIVYPIAFQSNDNMLVCAPTGAGKTDVAMLTVLRLISQYRENGRILLDDFKIVYVAPMKALAAEVVHKFSKRLACMKVNVRELTGDMQMTKAEINDTQMIVTTPEKWDVVTRKSVGDTQLVQKVKLLIIDEVHLLHEDRGSVLETLVARTLRLVESSQTMIRIVGLSATLPNYIDVATFLGVNPYRGMFYFDSSFRPIPLEQHLIGIKARVGSPAYRTKIDTMCYTKVSQLLKDGHQVMLFVHTRKDTVNSAMSLLEEARNFGEEMLFTNNEHEQYGICLKEIQKSRNKELKELFNNAIGIHHAGMLRSDRNMMERMFEKGLLKILCCTATLAWGVNLPAYAVVIKGTQVYNADKGSFVDLSILDVLQIFGRAGRPQFEDQGVGFIITSHDKLQHYVSSITQQHPIESSFTKNLVNNLNAEISLGTITNITEAVQWLSYTYLYVRMKKNPFEYGMDWSEVHDDPTLASKRMQLLTAAARKLHKAQMIVFDERTGFLTSKDLGRIASNFYVDYNTVEVINTMMRPDMTEADALSLLSMSHEFENIVVRQEEMTEMKRLLSNDCVCVVKGGIDTNYGKANVLLQSYISNAYINDFALVSDTGYVAKNASRLMRALFEIAKSRNWGPAASTMLSLCKSIDKRIWSFQNPLLQFNLPFDIKEKLDGLGREISIDTIRDLDPKEIGSMIRNNRFGPTIKSYSWQYPILKISAEVFPITSTILRITLTISTDFQWNDKVHGFAEAFYIWVEGPENIDILYSEYLLIQKKTYQQEQKLDFTIPIPQNNATSDGMPNQIFVRCIPDRWLGPETVVPVSFKHLILPSNERAQHTDLLDLKPLPISALKDDLLIAICAQRFQYFNPVQTQVFHTLYNTRANVLLGAPTGSGKTLAAELAMWSSFRDYPNSKVVYIAPLKALVRERVKDWSKRLMPAMNMKLVELTGDVTPDLRSIETANVIITTPEKWDGISRSWRSRKYVTEVSCVIIDEIHLLGADRGPILEVIVSRMNYIGTQTKKDIRIVGLSTALANAGDLADWLGIGHIGLFNFRHSVRPVPLEIYIEAYPGKFYCPRMISMNKPAYSAILTHSPTQPVIVFVSSRRQTRLTANDFINLLGGDDNPRKFLHMDEYEMDAVVERIKDPSLKMSLPFGIGLHHAGLVESDRQIVEELFCNEKIQILVATSTLAWGVNFPAHLVVVKGTEYYDPKIKGYQDFPITDVLQMMGRAGRPQFDSTGVAVILVHDIKKNFYKKFLHEPFPVESSLHKCLHDHLNAEIATGTIKNKQDAMDYITWTYLYRRVPMNPTYYGCKDSSEQSVNEYLSELIEKTLEDLRNSGCITMDEYLVESTPLGLICSHYYLQYSTMLVFAKRLHRTYRSTKIQEDDYEHGDFSRLLRILCDSAEYKELPLRHNEEFQNRDLELDLPIPLVERRKNEFSNDVDPTYEIPHAKAFLLLEAHLSRITKFPVADYVTDTISVLDQAIRIVQAMIDVSVLQGYLRLAMGIISILPSIKQALWPTDDPLLSLPFLETEDLSQLKQQNGPLKITQLQKMSPSEISKVFSKVQKLSKSQIADIMQAIALFPSVELSFDIPGAKNKEGRWFLTGGQEYKIKINVKRLNAYKRKGDMYTIHSPIFPKAQMEGWFLILGNESTDELIALKRLSPQPGQKEYISTSLSFLAPEDAGEYDIQLNLLSDGYFGVDVKAKLFLSIFSE